MDAQRCKVAYVTGSSKGIGKALTELLLKSDFKVIGLSRSNRIEHPNFSYHEIDLMDLDSVKNFSYEISGDQVVLVNNAGLIGQIGRIGTIDSDSIQSVMKVNTIAPQILINRFIKRFVNEKGCFQVLNISSGAGKRPIDAWATYCASKAGLDLFSEVVAQELEWRGHTNWHIHSCAPGVVDTEMQDHIRSTRAEDFGLVDTFVAMKRNNELSLPSDVAKKLLELINAPEKFKDVVLSISEF